MKNKIGSIILLFSFISHSPFHHDVMTYTSWRSPPVQFIFFWILLAKWILVIDRRKTKKLLLSSNPAHPRPQLTSLNRENPELFEVGDMGDADDAAAYARANPNEAFSEKFLKYKTWCDEIEALTKPRAATPVQEAAKPKFCPNCGAPYEGGKFCQSCGSKLL